MPTLLRVLQQGLVDPSAEAGQQHDGDQYSVGGTLAAPKSLTWGMCHVFVGEMLVRYADK